MSNLDKELSNLQKKLQQDIIDMFKLEWQRNDLNYALSGVERGAITLEDIEQDMSLAISNYVTKDIIPDLLESVKLSNK